LDTPSDEL